MRIIPLPRNTIVITNFAVFPLLTEDVYSKRLSFKNSPSFSLRRRLGTLL